MEKIGVIGLGYVGFPLAVEFAANFRHVVGFDINSRLVSSLNCGISHIPDVSSLRFAKVLLSRRFRATSDPKALASCDVIIICVPTPLGKSREPDLGPVIAATNTVAAYLKKGALVILESTTYPGTTRDLIRPILEVRGMKAGRDFSLAFSPERVDPGNVDYVIYNTPKVVGGLTRACSTRAANLYRAIVQRVHTVSSPEAAEMVKLLENTFRSVNIGLVNEMAVMSHKLGLDVWEIIGAAKTKPFGFMPFYPGPGIGGHCIPLDPQYLAWKMRSLKHEPRFIDVAEAINSGMPEYVVGRLGALLNERKLSVNGSRILVLGAAYKPNVGDVRESPALEVMDLLLKAGAHVRYHDPFVSEIQAGERALRSVRLDYRSVEWADLAVILTAHSGVDYSVVRARAAAVFDARNALAGWPETPGLHRL